MSKLRENCATPRIVDDLEIECVPFLYNRDPERASFTRCVRLSWVAAACGTKGAQMVCMSYHVGAKE
jgi:hypothetical protein